MTEPRNPGSLLEQLAMELLQDERVLSDTDRQLLHSVLQRGLAESTGDEALDNAVAQRLVTVTSSSIADRIVQLLANEVVKQLAMSWPIDPGFGPLPILPGAPGRPVPGFEPFIGPLRVPGLAPGRPAPGFEPWVGPIRGPIRAPGRPVPGLAPWIGPFRNPVAPGFPGTGSQVSPSNPGNPPGAQVSPSNPGNPPGAQVSPSNPGNPPGAQVSPSNPGNPPGAQVSPSNPGNPPGAQVSPSNPGNPPGAQVSPSNPGNPPGSMSRSGLASRSRVPGVGKVGAKAKKAGKRR